MDEGRSRQVISKSGEPTKESVRPETGTAECNSHEKGIVEKGARLQAILDATVDGIITINERAVVQSFNKAAERIFGYSASEVIGHNVNMLQPSPYRENHDQYVASYLRTGKRKIIGIGREATGRRKDGSTFPLYLAVSEVWVDGSRYFTGIVRDLTEQKRAIEEIKSLARFPEENPHPILRVARDGKLLYANATSNRLLEAWDCEVGQYVPQPWRQIILTSLRSGVNQEIEAQCGEITYSLVITPIFNAKDVNIYGKDITERKNTEKELEKYRDHLEDMVLERTRELEAAHKALLQEEKLKLLGTISAEMAHEIRNPLMAIGGFARRLQKRLPDVPEIGIMVEESGRLEGILKRIENYLKPVEMRPRECSVNEIAEEAVGLLSPELNRLGVSLNLDLSPVITPAYVDPGILIQVIINVIRNAAKVMKKEGRITVETFETDQNIQVCVRAPVSSVKLKDLEHPFMPFAEGSQDISVPVCFRMLRGMGGQLSLQQEEGSVVFAASLLKSLHLNVEPDSP
jgi:PAS domain S-box-containing protein